MTEKVRNSPFPKNGFLTINTEINTDAVFGPFKMVQKVRKTTVFMPKTVVFMVAEAGFEPTTSGL